MENGALKMGLVFPLVIKISQNTHFDIVFESESESHSVTSRLFMTPRTMQPMEFSKPEYWSGLPCPYPGDLPNPGIEPRSLALWADSLPSEPPGKPLLCPKCC